MPIDSRLPRVQGVAIAPGTQMMDAIDARDVKKQHEIFNECAKTEAKLSGASCWFNFDGSMINTATGNRSIFCDVDL